MWWINKKSYGINAILLKCLLSFCFLKSYNLPNVPLAGSSFFDGGPLRAKRGLYWQQHTQYYYAYKFVNDQGKPLGGFPSPHYDAFATAPQLIFITKYELFNAKIGFDAAIPLFLRNHISSNPLGIKTEGGGWGDLVVGAFLQWDTIIKNRRPWFVHRLEFDVFFPTGHNEHIIQTIYPGNGFFFIDPYWAATFFMTKRLSLSWRLNYVWSAPDHKTQRQAGTAFHMNYTLECMIKPKLYVGINGYFLQQLTEAKFHGRPIENSKERVLAIGPGFLYVLGKIVDRWSTNFDSVIIGNLYFETLVRNRPQGIRANLRLIKYFD